MNQQRNPLTLSRDKTALLIIDMQEKFAPAIPGFENLTANILRCILTFQMFKMPIFVSEQYPEGLGSTVSILKQQFPFLDVIEKLDFSCASVPHFQKQLNEYAPDTIVVAGVESHVCVNQTVLDLLAQGKAIHVVADACGSRHDLDHQVALTKMQKAGATIATTEMVLFELAQKAGTESFKHIQKMVKSKMSHVATLPNATTPLTQSEDTLNHYSAAAKTDSEEMPQSINETAPDDIPHEETNSSIPVAQFTAEETVSIDSVPEALDTNSIADITADLDSIITSAQETDGIAEALTEEEADKTLDMSDIDTLLGNAKT